MKMVKRLLSMNTPVLSKSDIFLILAVWFSYHIKRCSRVKSVDDLQ